MTIPIGDFSVNSGKSGHMSLLVSAARANLVLGPIGLVLAVATSVLIARWLGPHTFADYATLLAVLWWLTLLGESGCNVGLQRYLAEAASAHARLRFYWVLQLRRWCVVAALTVAVMVLGPVWAARAQLPAALWGPVTFGLIGVLAGIILHAQLAASGLLATFNHARAMTVANSMSVLRAQHWALFASISGSRPLLSSLCLQSR